MIVITRPKMVAGQRLHTIRNTFNGQVVDRHYVTHHRISTDHDGVAVLDHQGVVQRDHGGTVGVHKKA
ncbi:Uncharacterised protein [Vibrio cholerae]|nr:Uncharacterised protein [Vibrio cholerae]CSB27609.1 Uncharacterised protein [Vibrio cholerae]CSB38732.1 Uncharacterised protein [Vibrio cholerae]CSB61205.1 Uncharacterised protein [Vibrio cholerae]CSB72935.1 Uncharacterised protein [Vibrio cholerae]